MVFTIQLQEEYGYVVLAAASTFIMNSIHAIKTGSFRKSSGVGYPNAYASAEVAKSNPQAYLLNCAQRAHANFTENHPSTLVALLIAGLQYPMASAALGAAWTVSRYLYLWGYCSPSYESGRGRYFGITHSLFQLALYGLAITTGVKMVMN